MALTRSKPASIFTPEGNSLAVFIDVNDGELKLKDVFGGVQLFSDLAGGGGLNLKDDALMTATLTEVVDKDNTASALLLSTDKVKAESSEQCPLEVESTGVGGGIALLDNTTTNNTSVGIGALGDNLCFRSGGVAQGTARLFSTGNLVIGSTLSDSGFQIETEDRDASFFGVRVGRGNSGISTNTAVGNSVLGLNTTGSGLTAFGYHALENNTTGTNNTAIGYNTAKGITTGSNNTILGANVTGLSPTLANNVIIADGSGNQRVVIDGSGNVGLNNGTSTTQATSVIRSLGTNSGIAIVPNGTGAITASIPDGTATGGNARGNNSVDLQRSRTANTQVASGQNSVISGGSTNSAFWNFSTISGGQSNTASNTYATVVGGLSNTSSGQYSISGGVLSLASGSYAISLGFQAQATGGHSFASIWDALASGGQAVAFGKGCQASGISSFAINSFTQASGVCSFSQGEATTASSTNSSVFGKSSFTNLSEQLSVGRNIQYRGDSQYSILTRNFSTGQVLSGGSYTFSSPDVIQFKNLAFGVGVEQITFLSVNIVVSPEKLTGTVTGLTSHAVFTANYTLAVLFSNNLGNNRIVGTPTLERTYSDANMATTSVAFSINPANGGLVITVTPPTWTGGGTLQWQGTSVLMASQLGMYQ